VSCIPVDPNRVETKLTLWQKYQGLQRAAGVPEASIKPIPADV
jgi:hypothetical protein